MSDVQHIWKSKKNVEGTFSWIAPLCDPEHGQPNPGIINSHAPPCDKCQNRQALLDLKDVDLEGTGNISPAPTPAPGVGQASPR